MLTSHDAFGYYGKAYGVTFLSPIGVSTETEASAAAVAALIDQIRAEGVRVYFIENSNDAPLVRQIASATGAEPGGELYPEALSRADGPAPTYHRYHATPVAMAAAAVAPKAAINMPPAAAPRPGLRALHAIHGPRAWR